MATTTDIVEEPPPAPPDSAGPSQPRSSRSRVALVLALVALAAAAVGALGPAKRLHATYSWPPPQLPRGEPASLWYTPLLLERWTPEELTARLPCGSTRALGHAGTPVTVLATVRHPQQIDGLVVTRRAGRLTISVGDTVLASVPLARGAAAAGCAYDLDLRPGRFVLSGGPAHVERSAALTAMPIVNGLMTGLDLRSGAPLSVRVRTQSFAAPTVLRQTLAWIVAAIAALLALLLVSVRRRPRPWETAGRIVRGAGRSARRVDLAVLALLLGWWVIAPSFVDDGWIEVRGQMYSTARGFTSYYASFGASLPNDYWLEWVQHWLAQSSTALVVLRIPALLCLSATWVLCRWILARVTASSGGEDRVAVWTLGGAFVVGAFAWGMTLRPEFATALFVAAVTACAVRFVERPTAGPLALAALLLPLAVTAHHTGLIALAPLLVVAPAVVRWARRFAPEATAMAVASGALLALLAFVGSDFAQRQQDVHDVSSINLLGATWLDEIQRYAALTDEPFGTPMRDASVALMVLAVLAFVFRRRHEKRTLIDLPPGALCVGLLLLVVVPDKLPWHFGALLGLGAVAIAAETIRLREDAASAGGWNARPFLVLGTVMAAISWVWATPTPWTVIDLRTLDWVRAIDRLQFAVLAILVPLLVMVVATFVAMRRRVQPWRVPWSVAPWSALMMAVPVVAFTVGVLVADTLKTPGWTPARQNLAAFRGNAGCGFGDDYRVVLPASARPAGGTASAVLPLPAWVPPSPSPGLPRFVLGPTAAPSATSPWFRVPASLPIGLFVTGAPSDSNPLSVEWGARRGVGVETLARGKLPVTTSLQGGQSKSGGMDVGTSPWHLFSQADLPTRPPDADVVRLTLATAPPPGPAVAVTAPVTYSTTPLTSLINAARPALVNFSLVPYLPCASLPKLQNGLAEVPGLVVRPLAKATAASRTQSPFAGLLDLYSASYAPGADSAFSLRNIVVFQVDRTIPGGIVALPAEAAGS